MLHLQRLNGFGMSRRAAYDAQLDKVATLLHFEGTNGGTVFTDFRGAEWTTNGGTTTSTSSPIVGTSSLSITDGTNGGIYEATSYMPEWDFPGDFTIEFRINTTDTGTKYIASKSDNGLFAGWALTCGYGGSGLIRFYDNQTVVCTSSVAVNDGNNHHVAVVRSGTTLKIWIDGVERASGTCSTSIAAPGHFPTIGRYYHLAGYALVGKLDEFRITKGHARYTAAFTPESGAFTENGPKLVLSTFNPSDKTNMTLFRNNCRVQADGQGMVRSVVGLTSGRRYFEFVGHNSGLVGFAKSSASNANYPGQGSDSFGFGSDGNYYLNGTPTGYGIGTWGASDVICFDIDITNKTIAIKKNNGSWGSALDLSASLFSSSPTIHVACGTTSARQIGRVNFGETPFTYSAPGGATAGWY